MEVFFHGFQSGKGYIKLLPKCIFIAVTSEVKIFPLLLFGYTFYYYNAILTEDLMRSIEPFIQMKTEERKLAKMKLECQDKASQRVSIANLAQN
jgi:hypothetical protein